MTDNSFCRLCALKSDNYVKVFDQQGKYLQLAEKIKQCLHIWLMPEDLLPKTICLTCCDKVKEYSDFYALCSQSQTSLKILGLACFEKVKEYSDFYALSSQSQMSLMKILEHQKNVILHPNEKANDDNESVLEEAVKTTEIGINVNMSKNDGSPCQLSLESDISSQEKSPENIVEEDRNAEMGNNTDNDDDDKLYNDTGWFKDSVEVRTPINTRKMMEGYVWKCSICDKEMSALSLLKLHYFQDHNQAPKFKCMNCDKVYNRYRSFVRHVKLHWNCKCFSCHICGKDFSQKGILQSHMTAHSEERPFACLQCGKAFKQYSSLYLHNKCHLPEEAKPKFPCSVCSKVFCSKHAMDTHMKIHTGEKNFICDICGKRFIAKTSLDYHIKTHDERKPHSCKICNKSFKTTQLLSKHAMLHTGQKPHHCDVCGKQFRGRSALKEHSRIHTGDMPYSCEYCGKLFRFKGILTVHRRLHTGERPYQCGICHREFTNWPNYNKHLKRRHKPGSEGESENEIAGRINQQSLQQSQQEIINTPMQEENINNTSTFVAASEQDVFSLEPSLYDNIPLDLAEPLTDLYRTTPSFTLPPTQIPSTSASAPLQLYYLHRYIRYPEFEPLTTTHLSGSLIEDTIDSTR